MSTSTDELYAALEEANQWKNEIGLPAMEKVEALTNELNYYLDQELVYKSELELLRNEMNAKLSVLNYNRSESIELMESKLLLMQESHDFLNESLDSIDVNEEVLSLKKQILHLQQENKELRKLNNDYMQINLQLKERQNNNQQRISHLTLDVNELNEKLYDMNDEILDVNQEIKEVIRNTNAEKKEYIENVHKDCDKELLAEAQFEDPKLLIFQRTLPETETVSLTNNSVILSSERSMISPSIAIYKRASLDFPFDHQISSCDTYADNLSFDNSQIESLSLSLLRQSKEDVKISLNLMSTLEEENESRDDEKQKEDIDEIQSENVEELIRELEEYKKEILFLNKKYEQCEKDLFTMNILYEKLEFEKLATFVTGGDRYHFSSILHLCGELN